MKYKLEKPLTDLIAYIRKQDVMSLYNDCEKIIIKYGDKNTGLGHKVEFTFHHALMRYLNMRIKPVIPVQFNQKLALVKKYGNKRTDYICEHIKYSLICE